MPKSMQKLLNKHSGLFQAKLLPGRVLSSKSSVSWKKVADKFKIIYFKCVIER